MSAHDPAFPVYVTDAEIALVISALSDYSTHLMGFPKERLTTNNLVRHLSVYLRIHSETRKETTS